MVLPIVQTEIKKQGSITFSAYQIKAPTGFEKVTAYLSRFAEVKENAEHTISFSLDPTFLREEYELTLDDDIIIVSRDAEGAFRALSTLKQLMSYGQAQRRTIRDFPDVGERGFMLDISRGKIPKLATLYELTDFLTDLKYNQIQLYIDGPVFAFPGMEAYTSDRDPLTAEELDAFIDYCEDRYLTVVPALNGFGHMEKWLCFEEFADLAIKRDDGKRQDTVDPSNEGSFALVDRLWKGILPHFRGKLFNIGMDEPFSLGMGQTKELCERVGKHEVYRNYLNRLIRTARDLYGKTPMFWDDIVFGDPGHLDRLEKDAIVLDWGYEDNSPFEDHAKALAENKLRFYLCPGTSSWCSFAGRTQNALDNIKEAARVARLYHAEGLLLTDWGDGGNPQFPPISFLPIVWFAALSWNGAPTYREEFMGANWKKCSLRTLSEEYIDKRFYRGQPIAHLVSALGDYEIFQTKRMSNVTALFYSIYCLDVDKQLTCGEAALMADYARLIGEKLSSFEKDTPYLEENIFIADLIRVTSSYFAADGKIDENLRKELTEIKERFLRLWNRANHKSGTEEVLMVLDRMIG